MSDKQGAKKVINTLRDADDLVYLITGRRIKNLVQRGLDLFGEDIKRKVTGEAMRSEDPDSPYAILEVRPDASNIVIRAAFRAKAREYHSDTGTHPDPQAFQRAKEAYDRINHERHGG